MSFSPEVLKLPNVPGVYILCLRLNRSQELIIGRLGQFFFFAGDYAYIGSACGPGGVRARLRRHLLGSNHPHWHIDALREVAEVAGVCFAIHRMEKTSNRTRSRDTAKIKNKPLECQWCQTLAKLPGTTIPVIGFGASDCHSGCRSHLISFPDGLSPLHISEILINKFHLPVKVFNKSQLPDCF
jgi:Uri superfamily endonuclease